MTGNRVFLPLIYHNQEALSGTGTIFNPSKHPLSFNSVTAVVFSLAKLALINLYNFSLTSKLFPLIFKCDFTSFSTKYVPVNSCVA